MPTPPSTEPVSAAPRGDAAVWWRIGWLSFGGPAGQIALMQRELVEARRWLDEHRFLSLLSLCMLLPGPEAQQLATAIGWHRGGWRGGLLAGVLFVLPGFVVMLALSVAYVLFGRMPAVEATLLGMKCAVVAIVLEAVLRLGRRALRTRGQWLAAVAALVALHAFAVPYPLVVAGAALAGALVGRAPVAVALAPVSAPRPRGHAWVVVALAAAWVLPLAALVLLRGPDDVLARVALLHSELALVAFGGAYALLGYVAGRAVDGYGWLEASQFADGLGLAETTPGPLILVLQFVAFVAAWQSGGDGPAFALALAASVVAVWFLFVPSLLWVLAALPFVERLLAAPRLRSALDYVTAAVVGVIVNLALWFAGHVLFARMHLVDAGVARLAFPDFDAARIGAMALVAVACVALFAFRLGMLRTLALTAALALAGHLLLA